MERVLRYLSPVQALLPIEPHPVRDQLALTWLAEHLHESHVVWGYPLNQHVWVVRCKRCSAGVAFFRSGTFTGAFKEHLSDSCPKKPYYFDGSWYNGHT
jgi:hypothetical protein